jgi:hypothetical protein
MLLQSHHAALGLVFHPSDPLDTMWDTWIHRRGDGWLLNYLNKHHSSHWDSVGSAISLDGAHWADAGVGIRKDCENATIGDCSSGVGSGAIWKRLHPTDGHHQDGGEEEYIMNFSQLEYDCEGPWCQAIFFATSRDLLTWTPIAPDAARRGGTVFQIDKAHYHAPGRWDTINALPREDGGYWGYWTAQPIPAKGGPADCGGDQCGAGFGYSTDGLHWIALATPGPKLRGEVGGVCRVGTRIFMTFGRGLLFESAGPNGPFVPTRANQRFLTEEGGAAYARLWGELVTRDSRLVLVTHQQTSSNHSTSGAIYAGLVKRARLGTDGVLRACWWDANDALRSTRLEVVPATARLTNQVGAGHYHAAFVRALSRLSGTANADTYQTTECLGSCLGSGLWLDGSVGGNGGLWLQTTAAAGGFGFMVAVNRTDGRLSFLLGQQSSPGIQAGPMQPSGSSSIPNPLVIDRSMDAPVAGVAVPWRAIVRNSWAHEAMVEFYVDGVLALPFTLQGAATGIFAMHGNATLKAAHRLSLPES